MEDLGILKVARHYSMDKVDLISTVDILYMVDSLDSLDIADNVNMEEHKHGY